MSMLEKYDLTKRVYFKNELLKSEYYSQPDLELTLKQKQLILYLISKIQPDDDCFKTEQIRISDYCELFNLPVNGGERKHLRKSLASLAKKCFFLPTDENTDKLCRWVDDIVIHHNKGLISIKLHESLRPYYLEVAKRCFTSYQVGYTLNFKKKYSYTIYENMKQRERLHKFKMSIEEISREWCYGTYTKYNDILKRVIIPSIEEINKYTDIKVKYAEVKTGKRVTHILFKVTSKTAKELELVDTWKKLLKDNDAIEKARAAEEAFFNDDEAEQPSLFGDDIEVINGESE